MGSSCVTELEQPVLVPRGERRFDTPPSSPQQRLLSSTHVTTNGLVRPVILVRAPISHENRDAALRRELQANDFTDFHPLHQQLSSSGNNSMDFPTLSIDHSHSEHAPQNHHPQTRQTRIPSAGGGPHVHLVEPTLPSHSFGGGGSRGGESPLESWTSSTYTPIFQQQHQHLSSMPPQQHSSDSFIAAANPLALDHSSSHLQQRFPTSDQVNCRPMVAEQHVVDQLLGMDHQPGRSDSADRDDEEGAPERTTLSNNTHELAVCDASKLPLVMYHCATSSSRSSWLSDQELVDVVAHH